MSQPSCPLTTGQAATLACLLESTIPKPGNVHRSADFADTGFQDYVVSAVAIAPAMESAPNERLGRTILNSVRATRALIDVNTNLGIILLLGPLAKCNTPLPETIRQCLSSTDETDCELIFQAIRLAQPGGLGSSKKFDVSGPPPGNLIEAMGVAADRDLVARQYVNNFADVFEFVVPQLHDGLGHGWSLTDAVIHTHLRVMHVYPDSLIQRKVGIEAARHAAALAGQVLSAGQPGDELYLRGLSDFDFWLRSDGNRRNPGTTADMITAALYVGLRRGTIPLAAATAVAPNAARTCK